MGPGLVEVINRLLFMAPGFLLGISMHEAAHALVALRLGDHTGRLQGRITLNPLRHFDPVGAIVFALSVVFVGVGFGWARPVPVNPFALAHPRRDMALVAIAGPASNVVQIYLWGLLFIPLHNLYRLTGGATWELLTLIAVYGVVINAVLIVFNLIPIPPLDGSRVVAWLLPRRAAEVYDRLEMSGFILVFALVMVGNLVFPGIWVLFSNAVWGLAGLLAPWVF